MKYYIGVDIGGTKSHALIADESGQVVGFGQAGAGNWEGVGYDGLKQVMLAITDQALGMAGLEWDRIAGTGMGIAGLANDGTCSFLFFFFRCRISDSRCYYRWIRMYMSDSRNS